ncbi:MAG: hypothetical protein JSR57_00865 [Verrucomicrobia bacterium]|nr:hypothetical protein [Verrucomicrobiota bacterium]
MAFDALEAMPALAPLDFFSVATPVRYGKALSSSKRLKPAFFLPNTSAFLGEEAFADVALSWSEEGLVAEATVNQPFEGAHYPRFSEGDALELFIDTRDLKNAGFVTRFCHHFVILPQEVQGIRALEITHFRTEDSHPLCDPSELQVDFAFDKKSYWLRAVIPASCLHGYDPDHFDRLGFTYRLNRPHGGPQHFALRSHDWAIDQNPRLWATLKLEKSA